MRMQALRRRFLLANWGKRRWVITRSYVSINVHIIPEMHGGSMVLKKHGLTIQVHIRKIKMFFFLGGAVKISTLDYLAP